MYCACLTPLAHTLGLPEVIEYQCIDPEFLASVESCIAAEEGASESKSSASVRLSSSSLPSVSPTVNLVPYGIPSRNNSQERTTEHSQKHVDARAPGTSQPTPQMSTIIPPQLTVSQPGLQGVELIYSPNPPSAAEESSAPTVYPEPSYQGLPPVAGGDGPVDELAQVHDVLLHIRSIIMTDEQLAYAHSHLVCLHCDVTATMTQMQTPIILLQGLHPSVSEPELRQLFSACDLLFFCL